MSNPSTSSISRTPVSPSTATNTNGSSSQLNPAQNRPGVVPTNNVSTANGVTVRARIDPTLTVNDVIKQLCVNLKIQGPPSDYALRDDNEVLVTNDNLRKMIKGNVHLHLVNAPAREGHDIAMKLTSRDDKILKTGLFSLRKYIHEREFAQEFISCNGVAELVAVIYTTHGNSLAYALLAMQNLMELDYGWSTLDDDFIFRIVKILSSPQSPINVCRPATAILKKLVEADPMSAPGPQASSSKSSPVPPPGSVYRYGFARVFEQMSREQTMLDTVVHRLGSADTAMVQHSMMLINSLLAHASENRWGQFIDELERLNVRKAVLRLMSNHTMEDLTSGILDFQANMLRVLYRKQSTPVEYGANIADLNFIWASSRLEEEVDQDNKPLKWRKLGFESEDIEQAFANVGVLGLQCLKRFVEHTHDPDFSKVVLEQLSRPAERRCPIAKASNEVVELLCQHWSIFAPGYCTSTSFQPLFLEYSKVHLLATQFFLRMWSESGSASGDFARVAALVRSQVKVSLEDEGQRPWHEVEQDFLECEYRAVRDRQMKELELEDDLLNKVPVRNLRAKIYKESYEFVRQQRLQCLLQGAWFVNAIPGTNPVPRDSVRRPTQPWRFMRLDSGLKYLHYVDNAMKFPVRNGLEDLPERIEIAAIGEIATGTGIAPPHVLRDHNDLPTSVLTPSPLSFSLISQHGASLADQIAPDESRWADWTDGLNMLRRDGGHVSSKETAGFVQALTEIGLKIKLLDLSGETIEIPSGLTAGPSPNDTNYYFSELLA
ncbi:hypothetical protein E1B28_007685 [Marasmius oreades]|uniref:ELMO domain-containing protein n=1 Tax=Marasmius oreades TaxID=181124 RepID=A0A9P7S2G4_9AGAR|nr:uncharacterized protein E1B28_007685 [Marasmius oreades]KAG7094065.1 hypothetical protein E1B28_007685 [Marasmius oreades]